MEKVMKKLTDSVVDKISMDFLRNQVLKNAYGNDDTVIAMLDPRILLSPGGSDHYHGKSGGTGPFSFYPGCVFPDRISLCSISPFRGNCRDDRSSSGPYPEGGDGILGLYYSVFRSGSGPAF